MKILILFIIASILIISYVEAEVIISEIMYDLGGSDTGREWIEIYSDEEVNLSGWKFYEAETNHKLILINGSEIFSGYAVIADKPENFLLDNPDFNGILFDSTFSLKNDNETIALKDSSLNLTFEITYLSEWGGDGNNKSIQSVDDEWCEGIPTPGKENECYEEEAPAETEEENQTEQTNQTEEEDNTKNETIEDETVSNNDTEKQLVSNAAETKEENKTSEDAKKESSEKKVIYQSKADKMEKASLYLAIGLFIILAIYFFKSNRF